MLGVETHANTKQATAETLCTHLPDALQQQTRKRPQKSVEGPSRPSYAQPTTSLCVQGTALQTKGMECNRCVERLAMNGATFTHTHDKIYNMAILRTLPCPTRTWAELMSYSNLPGRE